MFSDVLHASRGRGRRWRDGLGENELMIGGKVAAHRVHRVSSVRRGLHASSRRVLRHDRVPLRGLLRR